MGEHEDRVVEGRFVTPPTSPFRVVAEQVQTDISNATNRAPYPTLHLIREASIDRAVAAFPEAEAIFERNMQTMADLGEAGWAALQDKIRRAARSGD